MENQRKMINDCPLNVPNDGVVATPDDLNGYFSVCADQKDFCTCSPFDIQGMYIILISYNTLIMFYKQHCKKEISLSFSKFHSRCLIWL